MCFAVIASIRTLAITAAASGIWQSALAAAPLATPTFECMGLYWDVADGSPTRACDVRFRPVGETTWHAAQPLWFDSKQRQYRGSVVNLDAAEEYEFELVLANGPTETVTSCTWNNTLPVASTVTLPPGTSSQTLRITTGGTPGGYVLYTAAPEGSVIDVANAADTCVSVEASYVIVRGITCRGAKIDGLRIGNHKHVVIEGCEISGWGRPDPVAGQTVNLGGQNIAIPATLGKYLDAGIHVDGPDSEQIVLQGNKIHHARCTSNNWTQPSPYFSSTSNLSTHPQGPDAVVFAQRTRGRHVIRWNNIGSDSPDFDHMFNDALLAAEAGGNGFATDGDIYGNRISDCWDDGIEAERGDRNVRVWGNHFARVIKCVSAGYVWEGPLYVWGNVTEDLLHANEMPAYNGGRSPFIAHPPCFMPPPQENPAEQRNGVVYVYHNTMLTGSGAGAGWAFNTWPPHTYISPGVRLISRNNIWQTRSYPGYFSVPNPAGQNFCVRDFDSSYFDQNYDLHSGIITPAATVGANTTQGEPIFRAGHGAGSPGLYQLAEGSPGHDDGLPIANFNDGFAGDAPDRGAHEAGSVPLVFGAANWSADSAPAGGESGCLMIGFNAVADAAVNSTTPNTNYGSKIEFGVHKSASRTMEAYLRFTVSGLPGKVTAAKLRVKESPTGTSSFDNGSMSVRTITGGWAEATVTWNNRPAYAATSLGSLPANTVSQDKVIEIALDPTVFTADGTYGLALIGTTAGNDTPFIAREAGTDAPELVLTVHVEPCVPAAPSKLGASAVSESRIDLIWCDNSFNETGFTIERKTGAGGNFEQIATPAANTTSFSDTGRSASVTYYYRIRACGAVGSSGYSNEAEATPLPPGSSNLRFPATADTFVSESAPSTNYGGGNRLSVYQATAARRRGYLRFEVSGLAGVPVQALALELVESMESADAGVPFEVRKVTGSWSENGLTWNTQPNVGATSYGAFAPLITSDFSVPSTGQVLPAVDMNNGMRVRVELDPSLITGDGTYDLALIPVSGPGFGQDMDVYSREAPWQEVRPRLVINGGSDYTGGSDLAGIGSNVSEYVLRKGIAGRNYDDPFYSCVLSYYGILTFAAADVANIPALADRVIADYNPYLGTDYLIENVDGAVLGIVPLEIFRQRGGQTYQNKGISYANAAFQSTIPPGVSSRTRWWIDDMFMLGAMQASAYESTLVSRYADNAAIQMVTEGQRCQQPGGLAWHRNDITGGNIAPFFWGRGNGWMAAGITRTLQALPIDHPRRENLLTIYRAQMAGLRNVQDGDGMWHQVLDRPDSYQESSATALFVFSMANGIINGWLDRATYLPVVDAAWDALARRIQSHGRVTAVCWGGPSRARATGDYMAWPEVEGDNHGEGAVLLAVGAMIRLRDYLKAASYAGWASANGIAGAAWDDDFDQDGWPNGLEYALDGLDPTLADPAISIGTNQVLSFLKRAAAVVNGDVTYSIETSADLSSPWTPVTPDLDDESAITYTLPAGGDRLFARLRVTTS